MVPRGTGLCCLGVYCILVAIFFPSTGGRRTNCFWGGRRACGRGRGSGHSVAIFFAPVLKKRLRVKGATARSETVDLIPLAKRTPATGVDGRGRMDTDGRTRTDGLGRSDGRLMVAWSRLQKNLPNSRKL